MKKKRAAQAADADPSQYDFTNMQNALIQQNYCNFSTNNEMVLSFEIKNVLNL